MNLLPASEEPKETEKSTFKQGNYPYLYLSLFIIQGEHSLLNYKSGDQLSPE